MLNNLELTTPDLTESEAKMAELDRLIAVLEVATQQLQQMSESGDWALSERIQKRRRILLHRIMAEQGRTPLNPEQNERLAAIRASEERIRARACVRSSGLKRTLKRLHGEQDEPPPRPSRQTQQMCKAYGLLERPRRRS